MKKRILSLALSLALCLGLAAPAWAAEDLTFTDVPADAWYRSAVESVCQTGLFNGTSETTFSPDGVLTLSQAITLAARLHQYVTEGEVTLTSGAGNWYDAFLNYAKANGIVDDFYDPYLNEEATRAEMVQIFYAALPTSYYKEINDVEDNAIPDVKLSYKCGEAVYAFYRAGILTGSDSNYKYVPNGSNYFKPQDVIHRSEVAAILDRVLHPEKRQSATLHLPELPDKNSEVTFENLLAVTENYDPNVAYIARAVDSTAMFASGYVSLDDADFADTVRYSNDYPELYRSLGDGLSMAFHEEVHSFTRHDPMHIYLGDGEYIEVKRTPTFETEEMAKLLPESLRTSRYKNYVAEGAGMSSNYRGIYGLLNEFAAYCWSNVNTEAMSEYYLDCYPTEDNVWAMWLDSMDSGCTYEESLERFMEAEGLLIERMDALEVTSNTSYSYAEFRFWILSYLLYARENYPEIYQGILDNDNFRIAYTVLDKKFAAFEERYSVIRSEYEVLEMGGGTFVESMWDGAEYDTLMEVMSRPEYVEMQNLLVYDQAAIEKVRLPQGVTE